MEPTQPGQPQPMQHQTPAEAPESEIVGKPTLLAKYEGRLDAQAVLNALGRAGYPLEDVSVLFKVLGSDEVIDLASGQVAAGQSLNERELTPQKAQQGQTAVLLHPTVEQLDGVKAALAELGKADIEYAGETHAFGRPGGVEREDELGFPGAPEQDT